MRCLVAGAGALGSMFAARLTAAGFDCRLFARGERARWLRLHGVVIEDAAGVTTATPVAVVEAGPNLAPADLVLVCAKSPALPRLLADIAQALTAPAVLVTVQNGVEAHETIAALRPECEIVAGRLHGFFEMAGQTVRHVGVLPTLAYGHTHGPDLGGEDTLAALLGGIGMAGERSADIETALWRKFLLGAAVGGTALALGLHVGMVCSAPEGAALFRAAMADIAALAATRGVMLDPAAIEATFAYAAAFPADATSSLQRDVEAGRASEYDALPGAVLRLARAAGIPVPAFARIDALIRARGLLAGTPPA
ncbi:ketopantoate reductase family protein [Novosphingobium colocasiae]|uniref:2-dehydropantoate 2-reductase n=1 Tax=Novosphingobium colocasiae TaxID=1256513 RepID=A0A918PA31_9SPHN|nr:2-dehydropantoate 2-reductase [Novosphingobium colocasiae]GGY93305.1 2-dehydropantoate 2-reductase [Novosphingobium colocasiae]